MEALPRTCACTRSSSLNTVVSFLLLSVLLVSRLSLIFYTISIDSII